MPEIAYREHQYATAAAIALLGLILTALAAFAPTAPAPAGRHYVTASTTTHWVCWTEPKTGTGLPPERLCGTNTAHIPPDATNITGR